MDENKSAVDNFLEDLDGKDDIFNDVPEIKEEEVQDEPKEEKSVPFHKDPKVQRFIEKEIAKRVGEIKPVQQEVKVENDDDYYNRLIGNDTPEKQAMIGEYKSREQRLIDQAVENALGKISEAKQQEIEAERQADETLTNAIDSIEETYNIDLTSKDPVARKTRVDFMNFVEKIAPKNAQGEITEFPDMLSTFETFQEMRQSTKQPNRAKELASRGMNRSNDTLPKVEERITFDNIPTFLERLTGKK